MREKLFELLTEAYDKCEKTPCGVCKHKYEPTVCSAKFIADHLIENGLTVRESGNWIYNVWCSECGKPYDTGEYRCSRNYCPNCGADMRGAEHETD